ncbi:MAG: hypothetical protein OXH00_22095 [Candidatus Poribacteria bacterium]|nr:hypothetical protein [Candidatus Poribacteria bacterium]
MKKIYLFVLAIFCLTAYHAQAQIKWDAEKFMPLSEIKLGMKGKGYTVFSGTTVEEFDFEVVSIYYNRFPGLHIVWAKGISDNFKRTGSAGGMSGSPMYIDGRLIGALSRSYRNQREHANLFGITPIEFMIKVTEYGMQPNLSYQGTQLFNFGTQTVAENIDATTLLFSKGSSKYTRQSFDSLQMDYFSEQLPLPVAMSGVNSETMRFYKPLFDKFNLMPLESPGGGSQVKKSPVEQGQIVGVAYARGDYTAFGYGTITYIDGAELLAYGHSRDGEGNVNLPISGGYVHFIMPGRFRSSKVASATQIIGTLVQDRQPAIAGIIGKHPSYIPVTLNMETADGGLHHRSYEVIRHRSFSPVYVEAGAASLVRALEFAAADHTLTVGTTITLKPQPGLLAREIVYKNVYSSGGSPIYGVMSVLRTPLLQLSNNSYTPVEFEKIELNLKLVDKRRSARIDGIQVDKQRYRPGETVEVIMTLRPYLESPITLMGTITIPNDAPDGLITLLAMNATADAQWQRSRAPLNFRPKNINQLVKVLQQHESNTDIIFELFLSQPGLTIQGEEFSNLPTSVMSVMNSAKQIGESGYTRSTTLHRDRLSTKYVIFGSGALELVVDRNAP